MAPLMLHQVVHLSLVVGMKINLDVIHLHEERDSDSGKWGLFFAHYLVRTVDLLRE